MSKKSIFLAIPTVVLEELKSRYINQPYLTTDDHKAWLMEQGFTPSRSALGRYLKKVKECTSKDTSQLSLINKIICLEIASKYTKNKNDLLKLANELLNWVQNSD